MRLELGALGVAEATIDVPASSDASGWTPPGRPRRAAASATERSKLGSVMPLYLKERTSAPLLRGLSVIGPRQQLVELQFGGCCRVLK